MHVELAHSMPGRIRLRVRDLDISERRFGELRQRLTSLPGLDQVQVRPATGSIVLTFAPKRNESMTRAVRQAFPELEETSPQTPGDESDELEASLAAMGDGEPADVGQVIAETVAAFNRDVGARTHGVDLAVILPATFVSVGVATLLKKLLTGQTVEWPHWYNYLWYAYRLFSQVKHPIDGLGRTQAELLEQLMDEVKQLRLDLQPPATRRPRTRGSRKT